MQREPVRRAERAVRLGPVLEAGGALARDEQHDAVGPHLPHAVAAALGEVHRPVGRRGHAERRVERRARARPVARADLARARDRRDRARAVRALAVRERDGAQRVVVAVGDDIPESAERERARAGGGA